MVNQLKNMNGYLLTIRNGEKIKSVTVIMPTFIWKFHYFSSVFFRG